jgi:hypothetical protein
MTKLSFIFAQCALLALLAFGKSDWCHVVMLFIVLLIVAAWFMGPPSGPLCGRAFGHLEKV